MEAFDWLKQVGTVSSCFKGIKCCVLFYLLGDVSHSAEIVENGDTADLHLLNVDGTTSILRLLPSNQCWKLEWNMEQEFQEILLRNKIDCLSC